MKILFLEAVQNFGGARKSTLELADRLKSRGNEVLIVDFWGCCLPFVEEAKKRNLTITFLDKKDEPFLLYSENKFKRIKNYLHYLVFWLRYRKTVNEKILEFEPELIVVNNAKTLSILSKSDKYKIAYFARGWFLPKTVSYFNKLLIKKLVSVFIGVSQSTRQAIFAGGYAKLENIYVVPNAIDISKIEVISEKHLQFRTWDEDDTDRPFTILHCGGFLETKGQHLLIEIANKLKVIDVNFKIILTGIIYKGGASEKYYNMILQSIHDNDLSDKIEIILNKSNVIDYFAQCDVLVHPSYTEGLPRVAMEAMALGKPVIGNAVGGMTDYILNNFTGYLTNFNVVEDYVSAILKMLNDKIQYKFLSNNAKNLIESGYREEDQYNAFIKIRK